MEEKFTKSYIKVDGPPVTQKHQTFPEVMKHYAETKPEGESVVFVSTDGTRECVTWSQLYQRSQIMARSLIKIGIRTHEVVAINVRCCPEWLYATFGAMMAGAIPVSISFTYTDGSDLIALMKKMETCSLLILDPGAEFVNWNILRKLLDKYKADGNVKSQKMPYLRYVLGVRFGHPELPNVIGLRDLLLEDHYDIELPVVKPTDVCGLFQTSGSTGIPKLVTYTQQSSLKMFSDSVLEHSNPKYIFFNDRPFNWGGGYPFSILTGQTRVTLSEFCDPPNDRLSFMIDVIVKEKCTLICALPPLMHELIKRKEHLPDDWPVEGILTGGQPLTKHLAACIGKACKFLLCLYGGSEFAGATVAKITNPNDFTEFGCGKPFNMPGLEIKIVDKNAEIVSVNQRGEIYIRSEAMFTGYFNDPEKTKAVLSEDGWYKTDDIGRMTEDGEFFVEGRKSNMIISGGFNVAPEILENVMKTFPGVDSVIIVPVPDDVYYQVLCACIVKKGDCEISEEDIRKNCHEYHADKPGLFTVLPKYYMFLESFPETRSGKTHRMELEKIALQRFRQSTF
ncbi:3-[(3aS,4S,7aS)-7a-methyl-1,5-dioxo-octahydro-1H-inden-4-yl]propanoyl:CoA ligase-like [Ruditapes philippinarum]|uniref:3-[(3aS,4S,7aS)-7a-methyl-1, 5-dioxo-octahydro-1H-inden-4-yl]propanoyl:CoA ligase-like n=1 Tax=Ruditapes philippinarum TaxID=129788 RepID=UPI00295AC4C0|nr:3-[(3aS,4S,7aS)-7a-methyl-1,5-dioxo-octahydro-1H-inden-4-yl]propanoyl:CoA ligase-like [Ruditapes philippinarum]